MSITVTKENFAEIIKTPNHDIIIDFWAPWCGPCKMVGPVLEELEKEYSDKLIVGKINIDEEEALATEFGIMSIPTLLLYKNGEQANKSVGFAGKDGILKLLNY